MQPTRRQAVVAGVALLAGACTAERSPTPLTPDPDVALIDAAIAREEGLIAACERALRGSRSAVVAEALADHAAHLARLRWERQARPAPSPSATPAPALPLLALEQAAATAHAEGAARASRTLAPLLASLAASEAVHAALLT